MGIVILTDRKSPSNCTRLSSLEQQEPSSESEYKPSSPKMSRASTLQDIDDNILENICEDYYNRGFNSYNKLTRHYKCNRKSNCKVILDYVTSKRRDRAHFKRNKLSQLKTIEEYVMSQFDRARAYGVALQYWHLQMWALVTSKVVGLDNFAASITFTNKLNAE